MNEYYINNECNDIFESLELIDSLKFVNCLLEKIINEVSNNLESDKDKYNFNKLTTCQITISDIIRENEVI